MSWDGCSCDYCEGNNLHPWLDYTGVDEDTPCRRCGWYRSGFTGLRFPPGFCASSWRYGIFRIEDLRKEFPTISKEVISKLVQKAGENDMKANISRQSLNDELISAATPKSPSKGRRRQSRGSPHKLDSLQSLS